MTFSGWQAQARCQELTPSEADEMFSPSTPGKKPKKAKAYCAECPVRNLCFIDAVETGVDGFHNGTTKEQRAKMRKNNDMLLSNTLPPEPKKRRVVIVSTEDPHSWLDLNGPTEAQVEQQLRFLESIA